MFNFGTIGAYKQAVNNPRLDAAVELKNGLAVVADEVAGEVKLPTADEAKAKDLWVVFNIISTPELDNPKDFVVKAGEKVRVINLPSINQIPVLLSDDVIATNYADLGAGDLLVAGTDGQWVKADGVDVVADEYAVKLKVIKKSGYMDQGIEAIVVA